MARTDIPVTVIPAFQFGGAPTGTSGDAANDHEVNMWAHPKVHLVVWNTGANSVDFSVNHLNSVSSNYDSTNSLSNVTVGANETHALVLDMPADMLNSGFAYIDSADANFADLTFYAFTWNDTPRAGGVTGYAG